MYGAEYSEKSGSVRTRNMKLSATRYVFVQQIVSVRRELRHPATQVNKPIQVKMMRRLYDLIQRHRYGRYRRSCDDICTWSTRCCSGVDTCCADLLDDPSQYTFSPSQLSLIASSMDAETVRKNTKIKKNIGQTLQSSKPRNENDEGFKNLERMKWCGMNPLKLYDKRMKNAEPFQSDKSYLLRFHLSFIGLSSSSSSRVLVTYFFTIG